MAHTVADVQLEDRKQDVSSGAPTELKDFSGICTEVCLRSSKVLLNIESWLESLEYWYFVEHD